MLPQLAAKCKMGHILAQWYSILPMQENHLENLKIATTATIQKPTSGVVSRYIVI